MKIQLKSNYTAMFGMNVNPIAKDMIYSRTKKLYGREFAKDFLEEIARAGTENMTLDGFEFSFPKKPGTDIFCSIFMKNEKSSKLIHSSLGKFNKKFFPIKKIRELLNNI